MNAETVGSSFPGMNADVESSSLPGMTTNIDGTFWMAAEMVGNAEMVDVRVSVSVVTVTVVVSGILALPPEVACLQCSWREIGNVKTSSVLRARSGNVQ